MEVLVGDWREHCYSALITHISQSSIITIIIVTLQQMQILQVPGRRKESGVFGLEQFLANLCHPSESIMRRVELDYPIHLGVDLHYN